MKTKFLIFLLLFASISAAGAADSAVKAMDVPQPTGIDIVDIMIYRPLGLITTVVGSALYIGISPLTALTAYSPPHDAFEKAAEFLIFKPARFTFNRPLGVYYADPDGRYRRH